MSMSNIQIFQALRGTMSMLGERQKVLARNIANADTPGFVARDVDESHFQKLLNQSAAGNGRGVGRVTLQVTDSAHIRSSSTGNDPSRSYKIVSRPDSETTINGNSVVLEEQVMRVAETRMRYEAAAGLYEKSMGLLRLALSRPGR